MQLGAWRLRRCISRRAPKFESFFESRWVVETLGVCMYPVWYRSTPVEAVGFELVLNQAYSEREKVEERRKPPAFSGVC
jgi:hypothetical protein